MNEADEQVWKRRFYAFMGARLFGLLTFLVGVAVMFTGLARPGGWPLVGGIVIVMGLIDAILAPVLMKRQWEKQDRERR